MHERARRDLVPERPGRDTPYELSCRIRLRESPLEVLAGTDGIALNERARGRVRFRVLDAATGEVLTAPGLARPTSGNLTEFIGGPSWPGMDASGWCEKDLPEGPIELAAYMHDGRYRPDRRSLEIPADGVCEVEFRLAPAVAIELRLAPDGGPLPQNYVVVLLPESEWELATALVGAGYPQLSFDALPFDPARTQHLPLWPWRGIEAGGLVPGRYRFKVFPDDVAIAPEWIDVPADGVVDVSWTAMPAADRR